MKRFLVLSLVLIPFGILLFLAQQPETASHSRTQISYETARIVELVADHTFFPHENDPRFYGDSHQIRQGFMTFLVELTDGSLLEADYHMGVSAQILFQEGNRVSVRVFEFDGEIYNVEIRHPERTEMILGIIGLFLLLLCLMGGRRGVLAVGGLLFAGASIWFLLIPLTLAGYPVIPMTLIILTLITIATLTLLADVSVKSLSAILGCLGGIVLATILARATGRILQISGYHLPHIPHIIHFVGDADMSGLFTASVLVASIGAVMDTAVSIASAMEAIKAAKPDMAPKDLFKAGFHIGRDLMATMSNTLILAFVGSSLSLFLFMHATDTSFNQFINHDFITMEIIMGVAGSMGIILSVPVTAAVASWLYAKELEF